MKQDFVEAVDTTDLAMVRIALSNELLLDPRGATFTEMLKYAVDNIPDLFEENKECNYSVPPQTEWDEDFLFKVKNDLDSNFSKEKLAFYQEVVMFVGKNKAETIEQEERVSNSQQSDKNTHRQDGTKPDNTTNVLLLAGGAVLSIIGFAAEKTLLVIGGATSIIIGGVKLLIAKLNKK